MQKDLIDWQSFTDLRPFCLFFSRFKSFFRFAFLREASSLFLSQYIFTNNKVYDLFLKLLKIYSLQNRCKYKFEQRVKGEEKNTAMQIFFKGLCPTIFFIISYLTSILIKTFTNLQSNYNPEMIKRLQLFLLEPAPCHLLMFGQIQFVVEKS